MVCSKENFFLIERTYLGALLFLKQCAMCCSWPDRYTGKDCVFFYLFYRFGLDPNNGVERDNEKAGVFEPDSAR